MAKQRHESERERLFEQIEDRIGHRFVERSWLERALTHASAATPQQPSNERLEFLGDAVLGLVIAQALFQRHPEWSEGELTRVKSAVVCSSALARTTERLGLASALRLAPGLARAGRALPESILAATFEAVLGAVYLDGGLEAARRFCATALAGEIEAALSRTRALNWKSWLQQLCQRDLGLVPHYRVSAVSGPDHDRRFEVVVELGAERFGRGAGRTKKRAEQAAAEATLRELLGNDVECLREGRLPPFSPALRARLRGEEG